MTGLLSLVDLWLEARNPSRNTRRLYELEVTRFQAWLSLHRRQVSDLKPRDIQHYLSTLEKHPDDHETPFFVRRKKALGPRSREQTRRILHAFFEWAARQRHIEQSPFWISPGPDIDLRMTPPSPIVVPPLSNKMKRLLRGELDCPNQLPQLRMATIAHLAFWLGASPGEIASLTINDFIDQKKTASIRLPATDGSFVTKPVPPQTRRIIRDYLGLRSNLFSNEVQPEPLVSSLKSGRAITPWSIRQALTSWPAGQKLSKRQAESMSPRKLRQAFEAIANKRSVQERVIAEHFRTAELNSAIDEGCVPYRPTSLYAEIWKEMR